jgi:hypothetical protein
MNGPGRRKKIEDRLRVLVGKTCWGNARAADMEMLQFGEERTVTTELGVTKLVGEYGLHIQCTWRIVGPDGIVVGSIDYGYEPDSEEIDAGSSLGRRPDYTWRDQLMDRLFANGPLLVDGVEADEVGGFELSLEQGYRLEVFPDSSPEGREEMWRLLQPGIDEPHFVMTGRGPESD